MDLFAAEGFGPVADFDGSFLCPGAILFEKRDTRPSRAELEAHAQLIRFRMENTEINARPEIEHRSWLNVQQSQVAEVADLNAQIKTLKSIATMVKENWRKCARVGPHMKSVQI